MNNESANPVTLKAVLRDLAGTTDPDAAPDDIATSHTSDEHAAENDATRTVFTDAPAPSLPPLPSGIAGEALDAIAAAPHHLSLNRRRDLLALVKSELKLRNKTAPTLQQLLVEAMEDQGHTFSDVSSLLQERATWLNDLEFSFDPALLDPSSLESIEAGRRPVDDEEVAPIVALWAQIEGLAKVATMAAYRSSVDLLGKRPQSAAAGVGKRSPTGESPRPEVEKEVAKFEAIFDKIAEATL